VLENCHEQNRSHRHYYAQNIAIITRKIETLDDEQVSILADIAQDLAGPVHKSDEVYRLSGEERRLVREGAAELDRGEYASDEAVEAVLRQPWA
jgi:hypothetical protein